MKKNLVRTALTLGLTAIMLLGAATAAMATGVPTNACVRGVGGGTTPEVARTKAWDSIRNTLGGMPESVRKVEYEGSTFYLGERVTDADFQTVLDAGPEAVRLKPPKENGKLYSYPVYILWNGDKTVLWVHPIIFDYDKPIEDVAVPADTPAKTASVKPEIKPTGQMNAGEKTAYMLTEEYADAVSDEFYRLLNEHRAANGLRELEDSLELQDYADIRADEQRSRKGHTRPDGSAAGSGWHGSKNNLNTRYAENTLATGALGPDPIGTARGIFSIWKDSDGHNRHMLYNFRAEIKMGFGIAPKLDKDGFVTSGAVFASGY
jgi:uncharacterized protein YkwD